MWSLCLAPDHEAGQEKRKDCILLKIVFKEERKKFSNKYYFAHYSHRKIHLVSDIAHFK